MRIPKKRKIPTQEECNICYCMFEKTNKCFWGCSILTCDDCMKKQIKTTRKRNGRYNITYTCSQCKQVSKYIQSTKTSEKVENNDFSNWVRNDTQLLVSLFEKILQTSTQPRYYTDEDTDDEITDFIGRFDILNPPPLPSMLPMPENLLTISRSYMMADPE